METQTIQNRIFTIRGFRVMMDFHLAELYEVETKALNQGVKRNHKRFPPDFMIQLNAKEWEEVQRQMSEFESEMMWSQFVTTSRRPKKNLPYAFTEQGVAMLSSVLKSDRAIDVNISIMRTFVVLRRYLMDYQELSKRINALEQEMNLKFKDIHEALQYLVNKDSLREIGFKQSSRN
jgi:hypothetical protein